MSMPSLRAASLALLSLALLACEKPPTEPAKTEPAKTEPAKTEAPAQPATPVTAENDPGLKPTTEPLTPEEERLIAADPTTLTPEERIARGHALRKQIMMKPDSEAAQALRDARAAALAGEAQPQTGTEAPPEAPPADKELTFQAPKIEKQAGQ